MFIDRQVAEVAISSHKVSCTDDFRQQGIRLNASGRPEKSSFVEKAAISK